MKYAKNKKIKDCKKTKRSRIATCAISIVDNLAYCRHCNQNKVFYESNIMTILDVFISRGKNWPLLKRLFWQLGTRCSGRCRCSEVWTRFNVWTVCQDKKLVAVERWLLWSEVAFSAGSTVVLRGTNSAQFKNIAWPNNCTKGILNSWDRKATKSKYSERFCPLGMETGPALYVKTTRENIRGR